MVQVTFVMYIVAALAVGYILWDKFNPKGKKILIEYSELIGNTIVQHPRLYKGMLMNNDDKLSCKIIGLLRPKPPSEVLRTTTGKMKLVGYIKIDEDRYAYRVPNTHNQVFTYKRDKEGHVEKNDKGTPKLLKKSWQFCDDVKEPNVKHWERLRIKEIREKHKTRDKFLNYLPALSLALMFLFAVMALHLTNKSFVADKEAIMEKAVAAENRADNTVDGLNRLMDKYTGRETVPSDGSTTPGEG